MRKLSILSAIFTACTIPASAAALPYLTVGNARHTLEQRFRREEEHNGGIYELGNCYRVSGMHVNCYAEEQQSASSCEVWLWRVWETADQREREHHEFTMDTAGQYWESCPEESESES